MKGLMKCIGVVVVAVVLSLCLTTGALAGGYYGCGYGYRPYCGGWYKPHCGGTSYSFSFSYGLCAPAASYYYAAPPPPPPPPVVYQYYYPAPVYYYGGAYYSY